MLYGKHSKRYAAHHTRSSLSPARPAAKRGTLEQVPSLSLVLRHRILIRVFVGYQGNLHAGVTAPQIECQIDASARKLVRVLSASLWARSSRCGIARVE